MVSCLCTSYFSKRWATAVRHNSWGFRERDFGQAKPKDIYRIAIIGDSFTFGQGIEEHDRFSNLLEKQLNSKNYGRYEVLNFGRSGAETVDHVEILRDSVLRTNPDFILLQWFTNDVEGHDKKGRPQPFKLPIFPNKSALFYLLDQQLITIQTEIGWVGSYDEYMLTRFSNPGSASSVAAREMLQEFINITKRQEIPIGIVILARSSNTSDVE